MSLVVASPGRAAITSLFPFAIFAVSTLCTRPLAADPCCVVQSCVDVAVTACMAQAGTPGHCQIGAPCGTPSCNAAAIDPIADLRLVKDVSDVRLGWSSDPDADRYSSWYVLDKRDVPRACAGCGPERAVPGSAPSTIAEGLHAGALGGSPGQVYFYSVSGACGTGQGAGSCCTPAGACSNRARASCMGSYGGEGTSCETAPCVGACCWSSACADGIRSDVCGVWFQGTGTTCAASTCTGVGACCSGSGADCDEVTAAACGLLGRVYEGNGTGCNGQPCKGACCTGSSCADNVGWIACTGTGQSYQGVGLSCSTVACDRVGACCAPSGWCSSTTEVACTSAGSVYQGDSTTCSPTPCVAAPGACCLGITCVDGLTSAQCGAMSGSFQGAATTCPAGGCGACCSTNGGCEYQIRGRCGSFYYQGDRTSCEPNPCAGACCNGTTCTTDAPAACVGSGGIHQGFARACAADTCTTRGACCFSATGPCVANATRGECDQLFGGWLQGETCTTDTCALGACCVSRFTCEVHTQADCEAIAGIGAFMGWGTRCQGTLFCDI